MDTPIIPAPNQKRPAYLWVALAVCVIMLGVYTWIYESEPVTASAIPNSDYWNDKLLDGLTLIPALAAAILGLILTQQFKPSEPPHHIWFTFTLGWWMWVGGELLGFIYDYFYWVEDYPELTFIDFFWVMGYIFFGLSLYYQFRLIYAWKEGRRTIQYLSFIGLAGILAIGLTQWALVAGLGEGYSWLAVYIAVLYPVFDIFEGGAALWLFFLFGRGYMGRPWWGLVAFAFADSINIYSWIGGFDNTLQETYLLFDLFSAVMYIGGYMITALAFLAAIDHIHRGSAVEKSTPAEIARD